MIQFDIFQMGWFNHQLVQPLPSQEGLLDQGWSSQLLQGRLG